MVVNTRGSASAFTSQSVTGFDFFYKPKIGSAGLLIDAAKLHASGEAQKIPELWFPLPLDVCMKTYYWLNQNRFLSHLRTTFCALAMLGALLALPSSAADRSVRRFAANLTASEALAAMDSGRLTSADYVDALIERILAHPEINAFIHLDTEGARAAAAEADARRARGMGGPLLGLPILLKDSINPQTCPPRPARRRWRASSGVLRAGGPDSHRRRSDRPGQDQSAD